LKNVAAKKSNYYLSLSLSRIVFSSLANALGARVARWFVFKPKIPNLSKFWRPLNGER
jgi:hypothetical protein